MNFLLPLLVGGPDMANNKGRLFKTNTYKYKQIKSIGIRHYSTNGKTNNQKKLPLNNKYNNNNVYFVFFTILSFISLLYIVIIHDVLSNIIKSPMSFINSFLLTASLIIFYLDDLKLSNIKFIRYTQIIFFIGIPLFIAFFFYNSYPVNITDIIFCVKDNNINIHGHVTVDKEAGKAIANGISNIGSNIGLGATVAGVSSAVAKGVSKSSLPPVQKAGIIVAGGIIGGTIHTIASAVNYNKIRNNNYTDTGNSIINSNPNITKFLGSVNESPLEILIQSINILSDVSLFLIVILCLQLFYKYYVSDTPKLKILDFVFPNHSNKIKNLIYKIIKLNKNMNSVYIIIIIILLIISLSTISYTSLELYSNIDSYISVHNNIKK